VPAGKVLVLATGSTYDFPGGVGPYKSIVAYSAICQHLGCQPPEIHFYPPEYMKVGMPAPADITATAILAAKRAGVPGVITAIVTVHLRSVSRCSGPHWADGETPSGCGLRVGSVH